MRFAAKTEEEIQNFGLIEPGQYPFQVIEAIDQVARSGREMIKLKLKVWDATGVERIVFDYLLEAMAHKLRHFCDATGLTDRYESGELTSNDCVGKSAKLDLIIQKGEPNPNGGFYADKNSVKDYLVFDGQVNSEVKNDFPDDSIPF